MGKLPLHGACLALAALGAYACGCAGPRLPAARPTLDLIDRAADRERARDYAAAESLYQQAKREAPDQRSRIFATREHARALVFWGRHAAAESELSALVALAPAAAPAWHDLAMLRHRRGDTAGAIAGFRRAIAAARRDPRPRIALCAVLVNERRYDAAIAEYQALLELPLPAHVRTAVHEALALLHRAAADEVRRTAE
jgi:tetratricopeptide (TPR) repeat protein